MFGKCSASVRQANVRQIFTSVYFAWNFLSWSDASDVVRPAITATAAGLLDSSCSCYCFNDRQTGLCTV